MRYLGGKFRQGPAIAQKVLPHLVGPDVIYIEPFCGALGSAHRVAELMTERLQFVPVWLSDVQQGLITMWRAVLQEGWIPPDSVSEAEYNVLKRAQDPMNPLTAFVGYGCAFAAKYFGTYARCDRTNHDMVQPYAKQARASVLRRIAALRPIETLLTLECRDYRDYADIKGAVFYLDPPYAGRTHQNSKIARFDSAEFWEFARKLSQDNVVFVSEFIWPKDFTVVHSWGDTVVRHWSSTGSDGTEEALVVLRSSAGEAAKVE